MVAHLVKNLPAMQEIWVPSLGWEDPLEEGKATPSSALAWRIPMDRGAWWATVHVVAESDTSEWQGTAQQDKQFGGAVRTPQALGPKLMEMLAPQAAL